MIELETEILVVGSGFGGAVAASRLVEQGCQVVMLERGPWRKTLPVASMNVRLTAELPRASWWQLLRNGLASVTDARLTTARGIGINRRTGTFEVNNHRRFLSVCTSQVGGGSLVWGGAVARPWREDYWDNRADDVSQSAMDKHFERVSRELGCSVMGDAQEVPDHWARIWAAKEFLDFSASSTISVAHRLPGRVENGETKWGITRRESEFRGHMSLGCLDGSKASTDAVYIGPSLAQGMTLLANCEARQISRTESGQYTVRARRVDTGEVVLVRCQRLILGAGTYNTLRLLIDAQQRNALAPTPGLGIGISGNGDEPALLWNVRSENQSEPRRGLFSIFHLRGGRRDLQHGLIEFDLPGSRLFRRMVKALNNTLLLVSMGVDASDGKASGKGRRLSIRFDPSNSAANQDGRRENREIARRLGLRSLFVPRRLTLHLSGGARVANSATEGVVNGFGEAWNNPGLYVVDAAAIPEAPGTPPSLNIAAWASHVAEGISKQHCHGAADSAHASHGPLLNSANFNELALLYACLPKPLPQAVDSSQPVKGRWRATRLARSRRIWQRGRTNLKCIDFEVDDCESTLDTLQPRVHLHNTFCLANAWDGSGLTWQWSGVGGGEVVELQARVLNNEQGLLAAVNHAGTSAGWFLLNSI